MNIKYREYLLFEFYELSDRLLLYSHSKQCNDSSHEGNVSGRIPVVTSCAQPESTLDVSNVDLFSAHSFAEVGQGICLFCRHGWEVKGSPPIVPAIKHIVVDLNMAIGQIKKSGAQLHDQAHIPLKKGRPEILSNLCGFRLDDFPDRSNISAL